MPVPALPDVFCRYGASMGRPDACPVESTAPVKFSLGRVQLNAGGYDAGGAYWGIGAPLYRAIGDNGAVLHVRARDRQAARAHVLAEYPAARFYR